MVTCEYLGKGSNITFDAMENGASRGEFRLPDGSNRPFLIDEKGAYDVKVGGFLDVLVTEGKRTQVMVIGVHEEEE